MKKVILFVTVFALILTSCSDDNPSDRFVGKWTLHQILVNNVEQTMSDCQRRTSFDVNADGTYQHNDYFPTSLGCSPSEEKGLWINQGNNMYAFSSSGDVEVLKLSFVNNTFSYERVEGSTTTKAVYIRN